MISFSTSTGKSNSLNGPVRVAPIEAHSLSLPFNSFFSNSWCLENSSFVSAEGRGIFVEKAPFPSENKGWLPRDGSWMVRWSPCPRSSDDLEFSIGNLGDSLWSSISSAIEIKPTGPHLVVVPLPQALINLRITGFLLSRISLWERADF